jgi:endonuclease YncB( thermonuclease family)
MTQDWWRVRGEVVRIVDGDTFVATLDQGWGQFRYEIPGRVPCRVRILGYNTPERGQPDYVKAMSILGSLIPPGTTVWLNSYKLDSFGRALCDVELMGGQQLRDLLPTEWLEKSR